MKETFSSPFFRTTLGTKVMLSAFPMASDITVLAWLSSMRLTKAVAQKAEALCREDKVSLQDVQSGYAQGRNELVGDAVGVMLSALRALALRIQSAVPVKKDVDGEDRLPLPA